ncbi:MAG: SBBP repeat-containing protein, partial [Promethearchaeota archaeon]
MMKRKNAIILGFLLLSFSLLLQKKNIFNYENNNNSNITTKLPSTNVTYLFEWNTTWGGSNYDRGYGITLDVLGNVFITGYTRSYGAGNYDVFLLKYDSNGNLMWNITWGGSGFDDGRGIVVDGSGNVLITGSTDSYGAGISDMFLLKYNSDGIML